MQMLAPFGAAAVVLEDGSTVQAGADRILNVPNAMVLGALKAGCVPVDYTVELEEDNR